MPRVEAASSHRLSQIPKRISGNRPYQVIEEHIADPKLLKIAKDNPVVDTFLKMALIPSPTVRPGHPKEKEMKGNLLIVRNVIEELFKSFNIKGIKTEVDKNGTLIIRIPGSKGLEKRQPLMLLGHMDIVPGDLSDPCRAIHPKLVRQNGKEYIATDGTTTLGADDKACIAVIWDAIKNVIDEGTEHVPFEIVISPDEEEDGESIIKLDMSKFKAKHAILADETEAFKVTTGCASFVDINITISGLKGGHSAMGDQTKLISAADILDELYKAVGNRIVQFNPDFPNQPLISKNVYKFGIEQKPSNAIPTGAYLSLSLRSLITKLQEEEITRIRQEVKKVQAKYKSVEEDLKIKISVNRLFPAWNGSTETKLAKHLEQSAHEVGQEHVDVSPMHGATQINLLVKKKNRSGEKLAYAVIGPNILGEHDTKERVEWQSMLEVSKWLGQFIKNYSS